jgi:hypothetical protein
MKKLLVFAAMLVVLAMPSAVLADGPRLMRENAPSYEATPYYGEVHHSSKQLNNPKAPPAKRAPDVYIIIPPVERAFCPPDKVCVQ